MGYFWGPHYPDGGGVTFTIPAVPATLSLADPVTASGALVNITIRARAEGTAGNGVRFRMQVGTLSDFGELVEENSDVTVLFNDGDSVADIINLINAQSSLVEAIGPYNPSDVLIDGEDDFEFYDLEHGVDAIVGQRSVFWGGHYPDAATAAPDFVYVPGSGPPGVASFALELESGATVTLEYLTDIFKRRDGTEQRAAIWDDPQQSFKGAAYLVGERAIVMRNHLMRYAALGSTFLLGLPHEELTITGAASNRTVPVTSTATADWANVAQRVVVVDGDGNSVDGVIQSVTSTTIELDVAPGAVCGPGSRIMPLVPVLLEPQQGFVRHPISRDRTMPDVQQVESWSIGARLAYAGFLQEAQPGQLALVDVLGPTSVLAGVILRAAYAGVAASVALEVGGALDFEFGVAFDEDGNYTVLIETPTGATVQEFYEAIQQSNLFTMAGTWNGSDVLAGSDEFSITALTGAVVGGQAEVGRGVTITEFMSRPIFDRAIDVENTAPESLQAMNEIVDIGAVPYGVKTAARPDWGRHVALIKRPLVGECGQWQWFKRFLSTVRGRQRAFWLPTFREDLRAVEDGPGGGTTGQIVIDSSYSDFALWNNAHYGLMVVQDDETYFVTITSAVDNFDGTITLDVDTGGPTIPPAAPITMLSWLELCRFEDDKFVVELRDATFTVRTRARAVHQ